MPTILTTPADWTRVTLDAAGTYAPEDGIAGAEAAGAWAAWRQAVA